MCNQKNSFPKNTFFSKEPRNFLPSMPSLIPKFLRTNYFFLEQTHFPFFPLPETKLFVPLRRTLCRPLHFSPDILLIREAYAFSCTLKREKFQNEHKMAQWTSPRWIAWDCCITISFAIGIFQNLNLEMQSTQFYASFVSHYLYIAPPRTARLQNHDRNLTDF